jgi:P27 family predicted phage terminase small subunit
LRPLGLPLRQARLVVYRAMPKPKTGVGRGAKAQPIESHRARGNPGHKKMSAAPTPETAVVVVEASHTPLAPEWCTDYGADVWRRVWFAGRRHLSEQHDMLMVELLVEKLQLLKRLRDWLGDDVTRRWYTTANGQTVTHPAVKQIEQADAQITGWLQLLGFTVSDRARLGLFEIRVANELDEYRRRHSK